MTALGDVAKFVRGVTFKPTDVANDDSGVICLRTKNVQRELDLSDVIRIPAALVKRPEQFVVHGDLLVSSANSWNMVGKAAWVDQPSEPMAIGGFISVLRASSRDVEPRYLYRWFTSDLIQARVRSFGNQTTNISNLSFERCLALEIPLPHLREQRRIASILDQADALRAKRRRTLALLDDLVRAMFVNAFGDPITNPLEWPCRPLRDLGRVVTGNTPPRADQNNYGEILEWIKSDNIAPPNEYLTPAAECLSEQGRLGARVVKEGAVLVTCIAGSPNSIGNAALADREVAFNQQINAFVPDAPYPLFALTRLRLGKQLVQDASSGGMKGLVSKARFESIVVPDPPIDLISAFESRAERLVRMRSDAAAHLANLDELFASLQHRAFQGEL